MPTEESPLKVPEAFGRAVRSMRIERGVAQEALADRCGMSRAQLSKVETGQADLRLTTIFRLADALGVSPSVLIGRAQDVLKL